MKKQKFFKVFMIAFMIIAISFTSCKKEELLPPPEPTVTNPFIGTWRDAAYDNGSYNDITFNADMTCQDFFYSGSSGSSDNETGTYDYSESTKTVTMVLDGNVETTSYSFVNSSTLVIFGYTYFKQ